MSGCGWVDGCWLVCVYVGGVCAEGGREEGGGGREVCVSCACGAFLVFWGGCVFLLSFLLLWGAAFSSLIWVVQLASSLAVVLPSPHPAFLGGGGLCLVVWFFSDPSPALGRSGPC